MARQQSGAPPLSHHASLGLSDNKNIADNPRKKGQQKAKAKARLGKLETQSFL
jgi:hypothetical protein